MKITEIIDSFNEYFLKRSLEIYNKGECKAGRGCKNQARLYLFTNKPISIMVLCNKHIKYSYFNSGQPYQEATLQDMFYMKIILDKN